MGCLEPVYYFENIYGIKIGPSLRKVVYALKKCITGQPKKVYNSLDSMLASIQNDILENVIRTHTYMNMKSTVEYRIVPYQYLSFQSQI